MMRRDTSPGGVLIDGFLGHRPRSAGARWWHPLVREPAERALAEIYPGLVRRQALGEIFRYRSFDELARGGEERR
jgi:hypothetical protein